MSVECLRPRTRLGHYAELLRPGAFSAASWRWRETPLTGRGVWLRPSARPRSAPAERVPDLAPSASRSCSRHVAPLAVCPLLATNPAASKRKGSTPSSPNSNPVATQKQPPLGRAQRSTNIRLASGGTWT
jgi:hypothetical protein